MCFPMVSSVRSCEAGLAVQSFAEAEAGHVPSESLFACSLVLHQRLLPLNHGCKAIHSRLAGNILGLLDADCPMRPILGHRECLSRQCWDTQDALAESSLDMIHLVTVPVLVKEIAVVDAMRAAGTSNLGAASPTDLIQLLLSQSRTILPVLLFGFRGPLLATTKFW